MPLFEPRWLKAVTIKVDSLAGENSALKIQLAAVQDKVTAGERAFAKLGAGSFHTEGGWDDGKD